MKNLTLLIILGIVIFGIGTFVFMNSKPISGNTVLNSNDEVQEIIIGVKNGNYYPNTITVKAGQPVSISLDNTVTGCLRSFTIRELGIAKVLRTPEDKVEFTPTEKGTYTFACSMGMGRGTLIVE